MSDSEITVRLPASKRVDQIAAAVDRLVGWVARHWLSVFNAIVAVFLLLPFLAPVLMKAGATGPARLIYLAYSPTCHQLPERSFFLFGSHGTYTVAELEAAAAVPVGLGSVERALLRWVGNGEIGYKVAICQRDVAIYGSILLGGLIFGIVRRVQRRRGRPLPKLPVKIYLLLLVPLLVDGGTQLVGWRESTWELRLLTGIIFGLATVGLAYPYIEDAMADVHRSAQARKRLT